MWVVDAYINTTARGTHRQKKVKYTYLLQTVPPSPRIGSKLGEGTLENSNGNRAELTALINALESFHESSQVCIHTKCTHILNTCRNHWVQQWEKNGWRKSNGAEPQNADLWKQYAELLQEKKLVISWSDDMEAFNRWMSERLRNEDEPC